MSLTGEMEPPVGLAWNIWIRERRVLHLISGYIRELIRLRLQHWTIKAWSRIGPGHLLWR